MWRPATAGVQFPRRKERDRASHFPSGIDACPNPTAGLKFNCVFGKNEVSALHSERYSLDPDFSWHIVNNVG
jgi:hypothetical protein